MNLIKIDGYVPPSVSKYSVDFGAVNGAEEKLENGFEYIEQIRSQVPKISVSWINIIEADAVSILNAVSPAVFPCEYFFGTMKEGMFKCSSPKLDLKFINGEERYYNLSLTLEG